MADRARRPRVRWGVRLLLVAVVGYPVLHWFEYHQVFHPSQVMEADGSELGRPFEDVRFAAEDGLRLNGWFYAAPTQSPRAHLAYLLCHGNAGNISYRLDHVAALLETGAAVFAFDYRGYGRSAGRPGESGTYLDALAAHGWLVEKGFEATNIIALGESLGGGVASELAVRRPVAGLILQGTYTSIPDLGSELFPWLPVRTLGRIRYDTRSRLPRIRVPVLVMHSRGDRLVPFRHAERNFAAANQPKLFWEIAGGHVEFLDADGQRYVEGLNRFLALIAAGRNTETSGARAENRD